MNFKKFIAGLSALAIVMSSFLSGVGTASAQLNDPDLTWL